MTTPYYNAAGGTPIVVQGQEVKPQSNFAPAQTYNHQSHNASAPLSGRPEKPPRQCRDAFWAVLFYAHLAGIIALSFIYAPRMVRDIAENVDQYEGGNRFLSAAASAGRYLQENDDEANNGEDVDLSVDPRALLSMVAAGGIGGFVISSLALGFMIAFAEALVKMALFFNIVLFGIAALLSLANGAVGAALMSLLMCAFSAYYAWTVWSRIPFAASNLVTAVTAVKSNMGLAFFAYWSLVLVFLWSFLWSISTVSTFYVLGNCDAEGECEKEVSGFLVFLMLLSYYWTAQVISNVVHVTTAGTVGTWWFQPAEANGCCSKAVRDSYVRSMTTSFGSICLGSLIVAIIQAVKEMIHSARENGDSFIACCAECLIGCIESLVEYFNKWAFVYVGLYGFSFMEAGSNVMNLFNARGWTAIIADVMVDTVLFMVSLGVGFITGIIAVMIGAVAGGDGATLGLGFVLGFFVGYAMCATLCSIVSSAVNTVIVCYAEAPNEFQANHPELSERMRDAWRKAWPQEFGY